MSGTEDRNAHVAYYYFSAELVLPAGREATLSDVLPYVGSTTGHPLSEAGALTVLRRLERPPRVDPLQGPRLFVFSWEAHDARRAS